MGDQKNELADSTGRKPVPAESTREEVLARIRELEEENSRLRMENERLRRKPAAGNSSDISSRLKNALLE